MFESVILPAIGGLWFLVLSIWVFQNTERMEETAEQVGIRNLKVPREVRVKSQRALSLIVGIPAGTVLLIIAVVNLIHRLS